MRWFGECSRAGWICFCDESGGVGRAVVGEVFSGRMVKGGWRDWRV